MTNLLTFPSQMAVTKELLEILSVRRAAWTKTERKFVKEYIDTLPGVTADEYGNRRVVVGGKSAPPVLWSSHTDSVHTMGGVQSISVDGDMVTLHKDEKQSNCLGADDGTGVWLMRQMILRGIPGTYVFHRDEESGGQGSGWIAKNDKKWLEQFQCAIALDRKGYSSVITKQGSRTASDAFAVSLAAQLGGKFQPDPTGLFTDTAKYKHIIPECTNLSIGYGGAHGAGEKQNVPFALNLLETLCELDVRDLTIDRDPAKAEDERYWGKFERSSYRGYSSYTDYYGHDYWDDTRDIYDRWDDDNRRASTGDNYSEILDIVDHHPAALADWLDTTGFTADELRDSLGISKRRK